MATESPTTSRYVKGARSSVKTSSSRCTQCSGPNAKSARNLVVCIDGTSNQFGQNNTNVVKLFAKINLETTEPEQFAYYTSGIGTSPKSLNVFKRMERAVSDKFGMAIAWNMDEIIKDAYGWLARTYQEGDHIYLFGFSRGAYQVRVLAGMIHEVGLIRTPTEKQVGTAYDHYEVVRAEKPKTKQIAREFKNTFSWKDLRVHFVGVWDTVSSVGLIRGDVFLSTSSSAAHACHFRHALALDELRVKFMPEYFHEMNTQMSDPKPKDPKHKRRESTVIDNASDLSEGKGHRTTEIKEVWFAGSHSDVGGRNRPGWSHQAGNVSLLWMRREAASKGLALKSTDIVWVPDDLDFGISDSMTTPWKAIEYLPIKHQTCFSGGGEDTRRWHRMQSRRIIPGQKIHASILYANAYKPQATLGEGFDIPFLHAEPEDTDLDSDLWETGLFEDTAAQELLNYLRGQQGIAPVYLDRLLFMLRFKEGKECVRNVEHWRGLIKNLIEHPKTPFVRLVALVAYYEAAYDTTKGAKSRAPPQNEFKPDTFKEAKKCLTDILAKHKHRDGPRVVALLRPLTKHEILRSHILTDDVVDSLVKLLDAILTDPQGNFGQAMGGLTCLLHCEHTRPIIITKLKGPFLDEEGNISRLSRTLQINDSHRLASALRMVLTLTRLPGVTPMAMAENVKKAEERVSEATRAPEETEVAAEPAETERLRVTAEAANAAKAEAKKAADVDALFWSPVKARLRKLAERDDRLVGRLAVEILLSLYDENDTAHLNLRNSCVRKNVASALISLKPKTDDSAGQQGGETDPEYQMLHHVFGFGAPELTETQVQLITKLQMAVKYGDAPERTAATLTFLKLCETKSIRAQVRTNGLLNLFIDQLCSKSTALLAAYALATCLKKYRDMKDSESIKGSDSLLPKHIVGMLRMDYFDDAVGSVEGFQIFREFMEDGDLRERIKKYDITEVLNGKLKKGKSKEIRTSLICLNIFLAFDAKGPWADELVESSLGYLTKTAPWKTQKAGVTILSALAQTEYGVAAISRRITEIIEILLPPDYHLIADETPASPPSNNGRLSSHHENRVSLTSQTDLQPIQEEHSARLASPELPDVRTPRETQSPTSLVSPDDHTSTQERLTADSPPAENRSRSDEQPPPTSASHNRSPAQAATIVRSMFSRFTISSQPDAENSVVPSSWMMGPACALRILAQNEKLRECIRKTQEYNNLKNLHLTGSLVSDEDTSAWRIKTPNRNDVTIMLDKMIKAVDEEVSEEGLMSIGDTVLPTIKHWDRLLDLVQDRTVAVITILPAVLGVSALAVLAAVVVPPIYLSGKVVGLFRRLLAQHENNRALDILGRHHGSDHLVSDETPSDERQESGSAAAGTVHTASEREAQRMSGVTSEE